MPPFSPTEAVQRKPKYKLVNTPANSGKTHGKDINEPLLDLDRPICQVTSKRVFPEIFRSSCIHLVLKISSYC